MNEVLENKPYRIKFEDRPEYLHVRVEGEHDSYKISLRFWREIAAECERLGCTKLLVEEDIPEAVSVAEMYGIASELIEMFVGIVIAFVDRYADQAELNSFGELVAQNRGVRGRFFTSFDDAEAWLLKQ